MLTRNLETSRVHADRTHERWLSHSHRIGQAPADDEEEQIWCAQQCVRCRFYIRLAGDFEDDWGVCNKTLSKFDGRVMFEHDGCDKNEYGITGWGEFPDPVASIPRPAKSSADCLQKGRASERCQQRIVYITIACQAACRRSYRHTIT